MANLRIPESNIRVIPLPVAHENDFNPEYLRAAKPVCLYASSPDRGLPKLLELWPQIRKRVPEASLVVTYVDADLATKNEWTRAGVQFVGSVPFEAMKRLYHRAHVLLYPAVDDVETFCYTAVKAQISGCVPVVFPRGALKDVVSPNVGFHCASETEFVDTAVELLTNKTLWEARSEACKRIKVIRPDEFARRLEVMWASMVPVAV